ncbi:DUF305 domain-containing protein [Actinomadura decatromicini]|uniref:DUF305 domain-containing protein n=1 Tax=Actinomadura decatromicini TaxID=2604572 RepID=A0A5D3FR10_9ACTN|nr:DUF305 domain-containing protein [Actinomadura decatromicini]TYK51217.1 DUF305 domain-containing protein [Actinomadura decatromicini]
MKRVFALAVVPVLAVALTACGDDDSGSMPEHSMRPGSSSSAGTQPGTQQAAHNEQDVMFAQMMIPHHRQAIEMADLAASRASSPEVGRLAAAIKKAQDPEITRLTGWLTSWGVAVPSSGMGSMHHGGMDGMMSAKEMKDLEAAKGRAFDTAFLEMMIKHHQGAVEMAKAEQASGRFPAAKRMAGDIVSSQSAEIEKMRSLLKR